MKKIYVKTPKEIARRILIQLRNDIEYDLAQINYVLKDLHEKGYTTTTMRVYILELAKVFYRDSASLNEALEDLRK